MFLRRATSVNAIKRIEQELEPFLAEYNMSSDYCNVFEVTLLHIIDSTIPAPKSCNFDFQPLIGRISFTYTGLDEADEKKITSFFVQAGDKQMSSTKRKKVDDQRKVTTHEFSVDAAIFYNSIFPTIKAYIKFRGDTQPAFYKEYVEQSWEYLKQKLEAATVYSNVQAHKGPYACVPEVIEVDEETQPLSPCLSRSV